MSFAASLDTTRAQLRELGKLVPEAVKGFNALQKGAKENGSLTLREKELVALGIAIADRCEPCILFHVEALRKAGGTREDLGDVCAMAMTMGGGPALMYAARALAAWDEAAA